MKHEVRIVYAPTRNIFTKAITEVVREKHRTYKIQGLPPKAGSYYACFRNGENGSYE